ncbi:IclR family transcriptional regulator [Mycolicibacterium goodii]|uniref:Helix-turn-helix domain-containing protein n=1 Tax=Mycolicibacterium goodii TaxID=134601 RepID=A0ABS6HVF7_MYCGD|nr:helix-turn-helix domain-containing protein [Mycolicibacterium goodii]OKH73003.1 IclR family transcriptional regulator [Mycobacterium sp. SWH-M5]MBU8813106.1 helix-turn-helix domain-containing protein [Mycolicibacterium goodii]MBU8816665.1 helix-turn-helix domain-containing protein [Mycolicibacterium goodii]MBU8826301.1 helix-turn-helix domain-containing protein [Mycolicibacterium goodii]MBU8828811.1 helix-turn-helix domain-containing protein [Mycolicibacterium goodii]
MDPERSTHRDAATPVRKRHRMVDRVAGILELAARNHDGLTLTELARLLDAPLSSLQGLVNGLVAAGYLDEYDRRYRLGGAPYLLNLMAGRHLVTQVGHRELEAVHADAGLTTLLSVVVGQGVFYVDSCSSTPRYDYLAKNLVRRSLIRTSSGWVLLAGFARRDLWSYLSSLPAEEDENRERFLHELETIQETGVCAAPRISEVADGVAVAVREGGRTVAAVSVVGPHAEIRSRRDELVELLTAHRRRWELAG